MLNQIRICSLGVIEEECVDFTDGFTVLTGETGTGKTMVITSLGLLAGQRANGRSIRSGAKRALIEGRFSFVDSSPEMAQPLLDYLTECGGQPDDDGSVIVVRSISQSSSSQAYLGGCTVPVKTLAGFVNKVLVIHGQHDQLQLLRTDQQRHLLDRFAGINELVYHYAHLRHCWIEAKQQLADYHHHAHQITQEIHQLRTGLEEINTVDPYLGEEEELAQQIYQLSCLDQLRTLAQESYQALSGETQEFSRGNSTVSSLSHAQKLLAHSQDPVLVTLADQLDQALVLVNDVVQELSHYLDHLPADEAELDSKLTRQAKIRALTGKYAPNIEGILEWAQQARTRLSKIDLSHQTLTQLTDHVDQLSQELTTTAIKLSTMRHRSAQVLSEQVTKELESLAMGNAQFHVHVRYHEPSASDDLVLTLDSGQQVHAGPEGIDEVEFGFSSRKTTPILPLGKTASGGELSRIMLALELVAAQSSPHSGPITMVFDEIDTGVGGKTAAQIGYRLARLARQHQVIVVTHLPQVAAYADTHLLVEPADHGEGSRIRHLYDADRVSELARMLSGQQNSLSAQAHAQELLETARKYRDRDDTSDTFD